MISLKRIRENAELIKRAAGAALIAVVKDDAYGHGAERVALALGGVATAFAVSTVDEGAALRLAGVEEDILVLTPPLSEEEVLRGDAYGLILSLSSPFVLKTLSVSSERFAICPRVHLVVNTGMNRYGFPVERLGAVCRQARTLRVEGMYSHLYAPALDGCRREQEILFLRAREIFLSHYPQGLCHLAATGGALAGVRTDAVRAGIALYGYLPSGFEGRLNVKPAMKLYATVSHNAKTVGRGLGYFLPEEPACHAYTLRLGYGDGYFRDGGRLCMDASVQAGFARTGRRKRVYKNLTEYARSHSTTEYEVLVRLAGRAEKRYVE